MTADRAGWRQKSERTMARTLFALGKCPGPQSLHGSIRWQCARRMKKATRSPTNRSEIQEGTSGTGSSVRKSLWEMRARENCHEKQNPSDFSSAVRLDDGGERRLRRLEKRLLLS